MTPNEWLDARVPPPPPHLRARLEVLLREHVTGDITPATLVALSRKVLADLLHEGETTRASALELLAADALATYAFELQADDPSRLEDACDAAMRSLSAIASPA